MNDLLTIGSTEPNDDDLPKYSDPGRVLFRWYWEPVVARWCVEVYDYDSGSSLFWMNEGCGIDYVIEQQLEFEQEGWYVAENVTGEYIRGGPSVHAYYGYTDDEEEWYFGLVRYATEKEIKTEALT